MIKIDILDLSIFFSALLNVKNTNPVELNLTDATIFYFISNNKFKIFDKMEKLHKKNKIEMKVKFSIPETIAIIEKLSDFINDFPFSYILPDLHQKLTNELSFFQNKKQLL